jgi:sugar transferase (PEP-CTERM/EpsH1 system associated)
MRLLFVTLHVPYFPGPAARAEEFCRLRELVQRHAITLVPVVWQGYEKHLPALESFCERVEPVFPHAPAPGGKPSLLRSLRDPQPWRVRRWSRPKMLVEEKLAALPLDEFDLLQTEHSETATWLDKVKNGSPRVLDLHNVNTLLDYRHFRQARHPIEKLVWFVEWHKMRTYERTVVTCFDKCLVLSPTEKEHLLRLAPGADVTVAPHGVDTAYFDNPTPERHEPMTLTFVGKMSYRPNIDAALYFCQGILPLIRRHFPDVRLEIVGMEPPESVRRLGEMSGVTVTGWVEDIRPYLRRATVCVVPLRVGAGIRIKIVEALAMAKAVVSTPVGCEGLGLNDGEHLLIADSAKEFATAVCRLLADKTLRLRLGWAGRHFVLEQYDWRRLTPQLEEIYAQVIQQKMPRHPQPLVSL